MNTFEWFDDVKVLQEYSFFFKLVSSKITTNNSLNGWQLKTWVKKISSSSPHDIRFTSKNSQSYEIQVYFISKEGSESLRNSVCSGKTVNIAGISYTVSIPEKVQQEHDQLEWDNSEEVNQKVPANGDLNSIVIKGIPLKWFDIDRSSLRGSMTYSSSLALQSAFDKFGSVRNIEATRSSATSEHNDSLVIPSLNFDVYVQFVGYRELRSALYHLGNDKVLTKTSSDLIVKLDVHIDRNGYFTDASVRQRRFLRDELEHKAKERVKLQRIEEENWRNTMKQLTEQFHSNYKKMEMLSNEAKDLGPIDEEIISLIESGKVLMMNDSSAFKNVDDLGELVKNLETIVLKVQSQVNPIKERKEREKVQQRIASFARRIRHIQEESRARVEDIRLSLKQVSEEDAASKHDAVVAEIMTAEKSLNRADEAIDKTPTLDEFISEESIETYSNVIEDHIEESQDDIEMAINRLTVVRKYLMLIELVGSLLKEHNTVVSRKDSFLTSQVKKLERAMEHIYGNWSASTRELEYSIHEAYSSFHLLEQFIRRDIALDSLKHQLKQAMRSNLTPSILQELENALKCLQASYLSEELDVMQDVEKTVREVEKTVAEHEIHLENLKKLKLEEEAHKKALLDREEVLRIQLEEQARIRQERRLVEKEKMNRKRFREWQSKSIKEEDRLDKYYLQEWKTFKDRWELVHRCEVSRFIASSTTYETMLRSKIVNLSNEKTDEAEQQLRSLALESKFRAAAMSKMKKIQVQKKLKNDEQQLREMALATLRNKK